MTSRRKFLKWIGTISVGAIIAPNVFSQSKQKEKDFLQDLVKNHKKELENNFDYAYLYNDPFPLPKGIDRQAQLEFINSTKPVEFFQHYERRSGKTTALVECVVKSLRETQSPLNILCLSGNNIASKNFENSFCDFTNLYLTKPNKNSSAIKIPFNNEFHNILFRSYHEIIYGAYYINNLCHFDLICCDDVLWRQDEHGYDGMFKIDALINMQNKEKPYFENLKLRITS